MLARPIKTGNQTSAYSINFLHIEEEKCIWTKTGMINSKWRTSQPEL